MTDEKTITMPFDEYEMMVKEIAELKSKVESKYLFRFIINNTDMLRDNDFDVQFDNENEIVNRIKEELEKYKVIIDVKIKQLNASKVKKHFLIKWR